MGVDPRVRGAVNSGIRLRGGVAGSIPARAGSQATYSRFPDTTVDPRAREPASRFASLAKGMVDPRGERAAEPLSTVDPRASPILDRRVDLARGEPLRHNYDNLPHRFWVVYFLLVFEANSFPAALECVKTSG